MRPRAEEDVGRAGPGAIRRATSSPIVTAGLRCPPEIVMVAVIMTDSTTAWASAIPMSPIPLLGNPPFTTTTAAPTKTSPNVPSASATNRRASDGMRFPWCESELCFFPVMALAGFVRRLVHGFLCSLRTTSGCRWSRRS